MKNVIKVFENIRDKSLGKCKNTTSKDVLSILSKEDLDLVFIFSDEELLYFKKIAKEFLYEHFSMFKDKLTEKPYLTKHDLAEIDVSCIKIPSYTKYTSGSSGAPLMIMKSLSCGDIHRLYTNYMYNKYGFYGLGDVVHIKRTDSKLIYDKYMGNKKEFANIHVIDASTNIKIIADYVNNISPTVMVCYPSILEEIIRTAEAPLGLFKENLNYQVHRNNCYDILATLLKVVTVGETVSEYLEEKMREYGHSHLDLYSMEEAGYISHYNTPIFPDDELKKYEVSPFVDVSIDSDGSVIVTDLFNYKTPVINYNTGDKVCNNACDNACDKPCSENTSPFFMSQVSGRIRNMMILPDGSSLWPIFTSKEMLQFKNILGVQVIQKAVHSFDIIIKRHHCEYDKELYEISSIIKKNINNLYGTGCEKNSFSVFPIINHQKIIHHNANKKESFICCK